MATGVSGAEEFVYLLSAALFNYGSVISAGLYQSMTTDRGRDGVQGILDDDFRKQGSPRDETVVDRTLQRSDGAPSKTDRECRKSATGMGPSMSNTQRVRTHQGSAECAKTGPGNEDKNETELRETIRSMRVELDSDQATLDFSEIAGLETVKLALEEFACFFLHFPHLTRNLRQRSTTGILLFGPQGTGKTLVVKSFARKFNLALYDIRASAIMSKFVGESEKFIRALFKEIRANAPAVLMLDECDGLLCNPASDMTQSHNYRLLQNELKNQWSDLIYSRDEVIVIGATNKPHDIDMDGFGRRLSLKLHVDLPDEGGCQMLLRQSLGRVNHGLDSEELETLGVLCHNKRLSGYDIDCIVEGQLRRAIRSITKAGYFRAITWHERTIVIPCNEDDEGAMAGPWTNVKVGAEDLSYIPFTFGDVHEAILRARATVDDVMRQKHLAFASQYGYDN